MRRKVDVVVDEDYVNPEDEYEEIEYDEENPVVWELRMIRVYLLVVIALLALIAGLVMGS